jgi:hypothetical protein
MKKILIVTSALVLCMVLVLVAGCTQPVTPTVTPTPIPSVTTAISTPTSSPTPVSQTPGPTQTLPSSWNIEVQVVTDGQSWDPHIIVSCQGGMGLNAIQRIDVTVTGSDGVVVTGVMDKPLYKGQSVSLRSTNAPGDKTDRAEVWATTPQGDKVKIFDAYVPFRTY